MEECSIRILPAGGGYARRLECQLRSRRFTRHWRSLGYRSHIFHRPAECRRPTYWLVDGELRNSDGACRGCRGCSLRHRLSVPFSDYISRRSDRSGRHTCLRPALALLAFIAERLLVAKERATLLRSIQILPDADLKD